MERLMRLRQPAVVVALLALALDAVLTVGSAADRLGSGAENELGRGPELGFFAVSIIEPVLLLLLTGLLLACWVGEPAPRARVLTVAGLVLTAVLSSAVVGLVVASVIAMPWTGGDFETEGLEVSFYEWLLPPLTVAAICLMVQVTLLRRPVPPRAPEPDAEADPAELWPDPVEEEVPNLEPGWAPEAAVGTVWRRAGDATSAQPTTEWDAPGQSADWGRSEPEAGPSPETPRRVEP